MYDFIIKDMKNNKKKVLIATSKKSKFKKCFKSKIKGFQFNKSLTELKKGKFGLKFLEPLKLRQKHVDAFREAIFRNKLMINPTKFIIFRGILNKQITKKPNEIRMGKGKGPVSHLIMEVKPGHICIELTQISEFIARKIHKIAISIFGVKCGFIKLYKQNSKFKYLTKSNYNNLLK